MEPRKVGNELRCAFPGCKSLDLKRCPCGTVHYCGKDHQRKHWSAHREICKAARKSSPVNDDAVDDQPAESSEFEASSSTVSVSLWYPQRPGLPSSPLPRAAKSTGVVHVFYQSEPKGLPSHEERKANKKVRYYQYPKHDAETFCDSLGDGDAILLYPGRYDVDQLGIPQVVGQNLEIIGINAPREHIILTNEHDCDWFFTIGTYGNDASKSIPVSRCRPVFALRNVTVIHCGGCEGCVVLRPGFSDVPGMRIKDHDRKGISTSVLENVEITDDDCNALEGLVIAHRRTRILMFGCKVHDCPGPAVNLCLGSTANIHCCSFSKSGKGDRNQVITVPGQDPAIFVDKSASLYIYASTFTENYGYALQEKRNEIRMPSFELDEMDKAEQSAMLMAAKVSGQPVREMLGKMKIAKEEDTKPGEQVVGLDVLSSKNCMAMNTKTRRNAGNSIKIFPFHGPNTRIGNLIRESEQTFERQRQALAADWDGPECKAM